MHSVSPRIGRASHMPSSPPGNPALRETWVNEPPSLRSSRDPPTMAGKHLPNASALCTHERHVVYPPWGSPTTTVGTWTKPPPRPAKGRRLRERGEWGAQAHPQEQLRTILSRHGGWRGMLRSFHSQIPAGYGGLYGLSSSCPLSSPGPSMETPVS